MNTLLLKKTLCILLTIAMLLSIGPIFADSLSIKSYGQEVQTKLSENDIPEMMRGIIDYNTTKHIRRDYDAEQNEMLCNTIFINADGTKTMYTMERDVRYIDKDGHIKDKSIRLNDEDDRYVVSNNSITLDFSKEINKGIVINYATASIIMTPEFVPATDSNPKNVVFDEDDNYLEYYFNNDREIIKYQPMYDGLKEEIIINDRNCDSSYSFLLKTVGVSLTSNDEFQYFFSNEEEELLKLSPIVVSDSTGKSCYCNIEVEEIKEKELYRVTMSINSEYFDDPETVFPIIIDPTIITNDDEPGIEHGMYYSNFDSTHFNLDPNQTVHNPCLFFSDSYHYVGYNSTRGVCRELIRFPGLFSSSEFMNSKGIPKITFYQYYTPNESHQNDIHIYAYRFNNLWLPGANYNSITWSYTTTTEREVNFLSLAPGSNQVLPVATLDMTEFAQIWKANSNTRGKGLILINQNEASGSYLTKFVKSESYFNSYTNCMPYVVMDYSPLIYKFKNASTNTYMTVQDGRNADEINVYTDTSSDYYGAQDFKLVYIPEKKAYRLKPLCSMNGKNKCLDIIRTSDDTIVPGCDLELYKDFEMDDNTNNDWKSMCQLFQLQWLSENKYKILVNYRPENAINPTMCLTVVSNGDVKVTAISDNDPKQEWYLEYSDYNGQEEYYSNMNIAYPFRGNTVPLEITSGFGYRIHPISGQLKLHKGIDIKASGGTPLYSAVDGTVVKIAYESNTTWGRGHYIIIEADNTFNSVYASDIKLRVLYAHMMEKATETNPAVEEEEHVTTQTQIGKVGMTGAATGNHLHLSILIDGTFDYDITSVIDPMPFYAYTNFTY